MEGRLVLLLRYISAHIDIQYSNESDEQYRARAAAMEAHNAEVERIEKAFAEPMKGLSDWDCCCPMRGRFDCDHPKCPRASYLKRTSSED